MKILLVLCLFCFSSFAIEKVQTDEERGLSLAIELRKKNEGFLGEDSVMEMTLIDTYGSRVVRKLKGFVKEIKEDGDKSISIFESPKDVKGTKMLTWSHRGKKDDQWLYLPTLRRIKRISSSGVTASFLGSEFSFEDLGSQEIEKYHYKLINESKLNEQDVWVLERKPIKKSGYFRQILYISKEFNNPLKIEYFNRRNTLLKVAHFFNYKLYKVKDKIFYKAESIHMKNVQTKKESIFLWKERKLGIIHSSRKFSKRNLK